MTSGDPDALLLVCRQTFKRVQERDIKDVPTIVTTFADFYQAERRRYVESAVFRPYGLTIDDFIRRQKEMVPDFREKLEEAIDDEGNDLGSVIIGGLDAQGAHLYTVSGPGMEHAWNAAGYVAIGSGAELAESAFVANQYTPYRNWLEALVLTHNAKRRAEEAPGVGPATDLYYIIPSMPYVYFEPLSDMVRHLDKTFSERLQSERTAVRDDAIALTELLNQSESQAQQDAVGESGVEGMRVEGTEGEDIDEAEGDAT